MIRIRGPLLFWFILTFALLLGSPALYAHDGLRVHSDLDGDHRPDVAFGRIDGSELRIKVHLQGRGSRIFLSTDIVNKLGLELTAYDVNGDGIQDLVVRSIFDVRPVAVWLSKADGRFEKTNPWGASLPLSEDDPYFHRVPSHWQQQTVLFIGDSSPILYQPSNIETALQARRSLACETGVLAFQRSYSVIFERGPPLY